MSTKNFRQKNDSKRREGTKTKSKHHEDAKSTSGRQKLFERHKNDFKSLDVKTAFLCTGSTRTDVPVTF